MIGVQVGDDDRVDARVVAVAPKLREDAVPAVEQHGRPVFLDQVAAARAVRVLPGGRFAQHRKSHPRLMPPSAFWHLTGSMFRISVRLVTENRKKSRRRGRGTSDAIRSCRAGVAEAGSENRACKSGSYRPLRD